MAFARGTDAGALSEMNITPLVDVMMVLLVIFMVTVPPLLQELPLDLSRSQQRGPEPERIRLRIDQAGELTWGNQPLPRSAWAASLAMEAQRQPQPVVELETADEAAYEQMIEVLALVNDAGLTKVGFVER
jgi:biopolymer transport protein ExbD